MALTVMPSSQTIQLALDGNGNIAPGSAMFQAIGTMKDGSTQDVTTRVSWPSAVTSLVVIQGRATAALPGTYNIVAKSGSITSAPAATLLAQFSGNFIGTGFDPGAQATLDGQASGSAQIAYPLDGALFPKNLGPIYVHIVKTGTPTSARLQFSADGVDIRYYGPCESDPVNLPGAGCYVKLPLEVSQLFVGASEHGDI
jgi:hypothetical protein